MIDLSTEGLGHFVMREDDICEDVDINEHGKPVGLFYCGYCKQTVWGRIRETAKGSMWLTCPNENCEEETEC